MRRSVVGSEYGGVAPEARAAFAALLPSLLDACGQTSDPDGALRGCLFLADAVPSRAALFPFLLGGGPLLGRLCRLAADSPYLWQMLLQHMEYLDLLADEEAMDQPPSPPSSGSVEHSLRTGGDGSPRAAADGGAGRLGAGRHGAGHGGSHPGRRGGAGRRA